VEIPCPAPFGVTYSANPHHFAALDPLLQCCLVEGSKNMLWTICVILLVLWALGMMMSYTASGLIHILLVVAVVIMVIRLVQGRRMLN
jgi:uncharacterized membrane protein YtjA (UPF0391 family)